MKQNEYRQGYDFLYSRKGFAPGEGLNCCYYCGLLADEIDHSFPLIYLHGLLKAGEYVPHSRLIIVPSCHECNGILASHVFPNLSMRKRYLKKRLRGRYRKLLSMPDWSESDYKEMSPRLIENIEMHLVKKKLIQERLAY